MTFGGFPSTVLNYWYFQLSHLDSTQILVLLGAMETIPFYMIPFLSFENTYKPFPSLPSHKFIPMSEPKFEVVQIWRHGLREVKDFATTVKHLYTKRLTIRCQCQQLSKNLWRHLYDPFPFFDRERENTRISTTSWNF